MQKKKGNSFITNCSCCNYCFKDIDVQFFLQVDLGKIFADITLTFSLNVVFLYKYLRKVQEMSNTLKMTILK